MSVLMRIATRGFGPWSQVRRAEPWTGSAECYGSVASIRRITSLYPPYNSSLVGGLRLKERKAKSKGHSFLVRSPTRRSRGRGVTLWPVSPSLVRPRPLARALGASKKEQKRAGRQGPRRYLAVAVLEGKASVCTTCFFGLWLSFAVCRFVPAPRCSNPAWCKPSGPRRPARHCPGFRLGRPLSFLAR